MNRRLKSLCTAVLAVLAAHCAFAQQGTLSLADARGMIDAIVAEPAKMTDVMKQLAPGDQATFLSDVNAAIEKQSTSNEEKTAKYINVNEAALKGSAKGNLANLIAEVFATVPPEHLTLVSERFAEDLFNRNADPNKQYTDDSFRNIAENLMDKIESRTSGTDDAAVRNTLAVAMLVRSSQGGPADLPDLLLNKIPDTREREMAKNEWLPAALAETPDYEQMLADADAGQQPNAQLALQLAGPQVLDAFLADVASSLVDSSGRETTPFTDQAMGGYKEPAGTVVQGSAYGGAGQNANSAGGATPKTEDESKPWNQHGKLYD